MTDAQVLALLAIVHPLGDRGSAVAAIVWAKTEGMADVENRVRQWHEAQRKPADPHGPWPTRRDFVPACPDCGGTGRNPDCFVPCRKCEGTGDRPPTYEENHIRFPSGEPRP